MATTPLARSDGFTVHPATHARFADVRTVVGPKDPASSVCWCLSHRIPAKENRALAGPERGAYVEELTRRRTKPGVLAYDGTEVVGWAAVAPRAELPLARSTKIPHVDDQDAWSVWCIRVRPGHRGRGISHVLLEKPASPSPARRTRRLAASHASSCGATFTADDHAPRRAARRLARADGPCYL